MIDLTKQNWQPAETAPKDGTIVWGRVTETYRYQRYKPDGRRQMGTPGRWQMLKNEYLKWENCPAPDEWAPQSNVSDTECVPPAPVFSAETMREAIFKPFLAACHNYADCDDGKYIDDDATITVGDLRELRAILTMQAERRADNTVQRDRIYRAAERSNARFGQWMPERWVNIFVEELNK